MKIFRFLFIILLFSQNVFSQEQTSKLKKDSLEINHVNDQINKWSKTFKVESFKIDSSFKSVKKSNLTTNETNNVSLEPIIIHFKDGSIIKGNRLKFSSNGFIQIDGYTISKKKRYHVNLVNYVTTSQNYVDNEGNFYPGKKLVYRKISGGYKELKVISEGKVNLYMHEKTSGYQWNHVYSVKEYYVQRKKENQLVLIAKNKMSNKIFIRKAIAYFNDCPELISKINNNLYSYKDVINIVRFYNLYCL